MQSTTLKNIAKIEFGVLSAERIKAMAACEITSNKLHGHGSVYDERMGVCGDNNEACVTCGMKKSCPGHYGFIQLVEPVLHPLYYKEIASMLKCFCKKCHKLILLREQLELSNISKMSGVKRYKAILSKIEKTDICSHCQAPQPKILFKSKDMTIVMEYKQKKDNKISLPLSVDDIRKIFENVSDDEVKELGFNPEFVHPKNFIITIFPVIPPCSRPFIKTDGNVCDDDLTFQLFEICKINYQLKALSSAENNDNKIKELTRQLKFRIATTMNNSKGKARHPTDSRPMKGIKERLSGKEGRVRNNLEGKRVDYTARTVITPETSLKLNEYGVPYEVCNIHTKPEVVNRHNIEWLTHLINTDQANSITTKKLKVNENGDTEEIEHRIKLQYALYSRGTELMNGDIIIRTKPGASFNFSTDKNGNVVIPSKLPEHVSTVLVTNGQTLQPGDKVIRNGKFIEVKYSMKKDIKLNYGDVVNRKLQKGDLVIVNRQPTLHKGGMFAMEVVPMDKKSFSFNLSITKSLNADYDDFMATSKILVINRKLEKSATS